MQEVRFFAEAEIVARLEARAASEGRDRDAVLLEALGEYLALEEHRRMLTLEAMASVDAGRLIPQERVEAWIESLGTQNELPLPTVQLPSPR